jgi:hypothetical protein
MLGDTKKIAGLRLSWCTERAESKGKKYPFEEFDHSWMMP